MIILSIVIAIIVMFGVSSVGSVNQLPTFLWCLTAWWIYKDEYKKVVNLHKLWSIGLFLGVIISLHSIYSGVNSFLPATNYELLISALLFLPIHIYYFYIFEKEALSSSSETESIGYEYASDVGHELKKRTQPKPNVKLNIWMISTIFLSLFILSYMSMGFFQNTKSSSNNKTISKAGLVEDKNRTIKEPLSLVSIIKLEHQGNRSALYFNIDSKTKNNFSVFKVVDPIRLVIDVHDGYVDMSNQIDFHKLNNSPILNIRHSSWKGKARYVLDLKNDIEFESVHIKRENNEDWLLAIFVYDLNDNAVNEQTINPQIENYE
jgi:hypothetical protein